jgi:hypothetical protein
MEKRIKYVACCSVFWMNGALQNSKFASACEVDGRGLGDLPSEEERRIGVECADGGPYHHPIPIRERTLGHVREN